MQKQLKSSEPKQFSKHYPRFYRTALVHSLRWSIVGQTLSLVQPIFIISRRNESLKEYRGYTVALVNSGIPVRWTDRRSMNQSRCCKRHIYKQADTHKTVNQSNKHICVNTTYPMFRIHLVRSNKFHVVCRPSDAITFFILKNANLVVTCMNKNNVCFVKKCIC